MSRKDMAVTLTEHLEEARKRLIICVVCIFVATVMSFSLVDLLRWILIRPAGHLDLIFVTPPEALMANIRLAFIAGLILSMPLILYQLLMFVVPGLHKQEKKLLIPAILAMVFFFALGVSFAYFTVFPFAIRFFMGFASDTVTPMFTISNYLTFATNFIFAFGVVFQLPIVFFVFGEPGNCGGAFFTQIQKACPAGDYSALSLSDPAGYCLPDYAGRPTDGSVRIGDFPGGCKPAKEKYGREPVISLVKSKAAHFFARLCVIV
ncbi:twin-arginine translocase subunit TatC [Dethiobacter alkaliphilus]|uniref:Sec-independent protein translocase protein TatC n=1 Tax=Dethiobacter alkaliphilus AHT 1 TaxID=555088 RepID=C0GFV6_DETAL|nr:twin-arginine translocase subunit TatC [Dethiobacter alkaliphilus]EEG77645.1 Sec-independent protein translocase, TatC subunit [Dethiobacter alkaliphilus AHT 1]